MEDPTTSSSSLTTKEVIMTSAAADVESQQHGHNNPPHWFLVLHPSGVTDAVLHYRYPGEGTPDAPYVVDFLPHDTSNPLQYSTGKKWLITLLQALATLAVAFVSTAYSGGVAEIIRYFHVSTIVAILGISLFVLGFAIGPLLWAPLSGMFSSRVCVWGPRGVGVADGGGGDEQNSMAGNLSSSSLTLAWPPSVLVPRVLRTSRRWSFCGSSLVPLVPRR